MASKTAPSSATVLDRASRWFLESGIQEADGGVARYYRTDSRRNARVSHEITGYAASALAWLFEQTGDQRCLDAAARSGRYLAQQAWSESAATFPFEPVSNGEPAFSYFFDCGIIVRGLLSLYRSTGDLAMLDRAKEAAVAMAFDFHAAVAVHPILKLPEKEPLDYEPRWSRSPGCYQLKSAMAWHDVAIATGQPEIAAAYERMLAWSLRTHEAFLPGDTDPAKVMDRLHAYGYFLEALIPVATRPECARALAAGIQRAAALLREIAPAFERSDVYAQILRVRLFAHDLGAVPLDYEAAAHEAVAAAGFQCGSDTPGQEGGFWFGRNRDGFLPFVNPVSTAFCAQALHLWAQFNEGGFRAPVHSLI